MPQKNDPKKVIRTVEVNLERVGDSRLPDKISFTVPLTLEKANALWWWWLQYNGDTLTFTFQKAAQSIFEVALKQALEARKEEERKRNVQLKRKR